MCERDAAAGVRGGELNKRRSLCDYVRLHSLISHDSLFLTFAVDSQISYDSAGTLLAFVFLPFESFALSCSRFKQGAVRIHD